MAKARDKSSRQRAPREIPDADSLPDPLPREITIDDWLAKHGLAKLAHRMRAQLSEAKSASERGQQWTRAVERAARDIPIGQRPAPRPSVEPGSTEKPQAHLPPKAKPKARPPNKRKKRKQRTPNRRGRPRDFTHEQIRDLAEGYIKDHGLPRTRPGLKPSLRALCKKVKDTCPIKLPKRTQLQKILRPVFRAALQKWSLNQK